MCKLNTFWGLHCDLLFITLGTGNICSIVALFLKLYVLVQLG